MVLDTLILIDKKHLKGIIELVQVFDNTIREILNKGLLKLEESFDADDLFIKQS